METVPVFINKSPWNELVLRGVRKIKTISFNWSYRGPILLYTSLSKGDFEWLPSRYYDALKGETLFPKGAIVGKAEVVDVIPTHLAPDSFYSDDPALGESDGSNYLVVIRNPQRFKKPISFKPKPGSIRISKANVTLLQKPCV